MSAEHNHPPHCCCEEIDNGTDGFVPGDLLTCPACPEHGGLAAMAGCTGSLDGECCDRPAHPDCALAAPYTEQETTK